MTALICSCGWTARRGASNEVKTTRCPRCAQKDERERCARLCEGLDTLHFGESGELEQQTQQRCADAIRGQTQK